MAIEKCEIINARRSFPQLSALSPQRSALSSQPPRSALCPYLFALCFPEDSLRFVGYRGRVDVHFNGELAAARNTPHAHHFLSHRPLRTRCGRLFIDRESLVVW